MIDNDGNTALYLAGNSFNKLACMVLIINGAKIDVKNAEGKMPGDGNIAIKVFIKKIFGENKAFGVLTPEIRKTLRDMFKDVDSDDKGYVDINKCVKFNMFVEEKCSEMVAERDAEEFMKDCCFVEKDKSRVSPMVSYP